MGDVAGVAGVKCEDCDNDATQTRDNGRIPLCLLHAIEYDYERRLQRGQ